MNQLATAVIAPLALVAAALAGDFPISLSSNLTYSATTGANGSVTQTGAWDPADPYLFSYVSTTDQYGQGDYQFNFFVHGTSEYDAVSGQVLYGEAYDVSTLDNAFNSSVTFSFTLAAGNYTLSYSFGPGGNYDLASFRFTSFPVGVPAPGAIAVRGLAGLARGRRRG